MKTLLLVVNSPKFFLSHWLGIAVISKEQGFDVQIATAYLDEEIQKIESYGFKVHCIPLSRSGMNLFSEIHLIKKLVKLFRIVGPDIVHLITIKPVIYGGIAARFCGIKNVVAAVTGLGYVFLNTNPSSIILRSIVSFLYKISLSNKKTSVVFENKEDMLNFVTLGLVDKKKCAVINGAGVDLTYYAHLPEPPPPINVIFASRLLRDKGILEFLEATQICFSLDQNISFTIAGDIDPDNPASLTAEEVQLFSQHRNVVFLGFRDDIANLFSASHIVVLPSYREGLPKVLIEAAACGRAVITTDVAGCRHVIIPNITGLLVQPRNAYDLANAIFKLSKDHIMRVQFGIAGRKLAEDKFSLAEVSRMYIHLYRKV